MASTLPLFPRVIFTVIEPISLFAGFLGPVLDTRYFVYSQLSGNASASASFNMTPTHTVLALQLGNMYCLVGMIGLAIFYTTTDYNVVRNYLIACLIADIGHLYCTYLGMGLGQFLSVAEWSAVAWGNIGFTFFLLVVRIMYLSKVFGNTCGPPMSSTAQTKLATKED